MKDFDKTLTVNVSAQPDPTPIYLSIRAGEGDVTYTVFRDFDGNYIHGDVQNKLLGRAADLRGQGLFIVTLVTDTNPFTNRTSLRFLITGYESETMIVDADEANGTVSYNITLLFE